MKSKILLVFTALSLAMFVSCNRPPKNTAEPDAGKTVQGSGESVSDLLAAAGFQVPEKTVKAPDFTLPLLSGKESALSDYRGKVVLLNFWATWCPPCRAEMPSMETAYGKLKDRGIELLAVNLQEDGKTVGDFIKKNGYTFPVMLDGTGKVGSMYGARSIPTTYVIAGDGTVLGMTVGSREWTDEKTLSALRRLAQ